MTFDDHPVIGHGSAFHRSVRFETYLSSSTRDDEAQIRDDGLGDTILQLSMPLFMIRGPPDSYQTLLASDGPRYKEGEFQRLGSRWTANLMVSRRLDQWR